MFVKPGQRVLLKPNLLTDRRPEQAVTTHPELIRAVIRSVKATGGRPFVGDSPSNVAKIEKVWDTTGIRTVCNEEDTPLVTFEKAGSTPFTVDGIEFNIAKPVLEADVIINLPKAKTHVLTILTCAVKNLYGVVPGFQKSGLHKSHPDIRSFARLLAAINGKVRPQLHIVDAIQAMDGDGPSAGKPFNLGFVAASANAVAVDATLCRIIGVNPDIAAGLPESASLGLGPTAESDIEILGTPLKDIVPHGFRVPGTIRSRLIPATLVHMIGRFLWIRPRFTEQCIACGLCVKACPMQALSLVGTPRPVLTPAKCIGCCCCHEVCPQKAVQMKQSPLWSFLRRGRMP